MVVDEHLSYEIGMMVYTYDYMKKLLSTYYPETWNQPKYNTALESYAVHVRNLATWLGVDEEISPIIQKIDEQILVYPGNRIYNNQSGKFDGDDHDKIYAWIVKKLEEEKGILLTPKD